MKALTSALLAATLLPGAGTQDAVPEPRLAERAAALLNQKCLGCHGDDPKGKLKGGLDLRTRETALKGGDSGVVLVPGNPEKSPLYVAAKWEVEDLRMPPKERDRLSQEEVEAGLGAQVDSWEAAELSAACHFQGSRWAEAEAAFRRALAGRPERSAFHRLHIGLCLHAQGKADEARAEWRACAEAAPSSYFGMLARGLSTTWAEAAARRKVATDAASAAVDKLSRGWGALARIQVLPQHEAAAALSEWLEAARRRGGELGSALGAELTEARRAACGTSLASELLDEALRQARDDVRDAKGEDAAAAAARERLLEVMKRCLSPQK